MKLLAIIAMGCISHETFAAATQFKFARQPDGAFSGRKFIQQPSVRALNADGSLDTSFTGGITISKQSGSGSLSGTVTVAAVSGTARFTDLKLTGAGHYVLQAASGGLTPARSGMITVLASASVIPSGSIYSPTVWGDSSDATNATNYWIVNSHATASFATRATSVNVVVWRTIEAAYHNQAAVAVLVDGAYSSQVLAAWQGSNSATVSLPAGNKIVTFVNGPRSRPVGSAEGTYLKSVQFNADATEQFPATPKDNIVLLGDSILTDFLAAPVGSYGAISRLKKYLYGRQDVMIEGYGGAKLKDYAVDSTARAATVRKLASYAPSTIITNLAANDYQGAGAWSAASYGAALAALLTDIHADMPLVKIIVCTMVTRPLGEGSNGFGDNAAAYRTAAANAASGKSYCTVIDGPSQLWNGTNTDDDAHPNNIGSAVVYLGLRTILQFQNP